jgi:ParB family transcriptional regulator, chromosome partitioning protein
MMPADPKRHGLGRGLSALLGDEGEDYAALTRMRSPRTAGIEQLKPSRLQPRRSIREDDLADLARSIAEKGVLQPILVRRDPDDPAKLEIIAGERRWRAAQIAQLHEVPVLVRDLSDREVLEVALIENLQRQDLTPLDEAEGYRRLLEEFQHSQEELAKTVGKSRSHVANMMRLLALPEPVKRLLDAGSLTAGHARALLAAEDPAALARIVVDQALNVRQTEQLAASGRRPHREAKQAAAKDADTAALERDLGNLLGLPVEIRFKGAGGALLLHYATLDQLDDILHRLSHGAHGRRTGNAGA